MPPDPLRTLPLGEGDVGGFVTGARHVGGPYVSQLKVEAARVVRAFEDDRCTR